MASQTSIRLPPEMLRALSKLARQRGVPKSQLVREAIEQYLASAPAGNAAQPMSVRERSAPYIGSIRLSKSAERDDVSVRIRRQNWRP
jgi:predicted transcriptional regulator